MGYSPISRIKGDFQKEEVLNQRSEVIENIQVEEILVEDIPSPLRTYIYYYIDIEKEGPPPYNDSNDYTTMLVLSASQPSA